MDIPGDTQHHISVGNINVDITMVVPRLPGREETVTAEEGWIGPGGSAANYAVAVSRLGHRASLVSIAGVEASVLGVLEVLRSEGVDLSYVRVTRDPGNVTVILLPPGRSSRTMISLRRASRISVDDIPGEGGHLHLASVDPGLVVEASRRWGGPTISYDPGGEAFRDPAGVAEAARHVDFLLLNSNELKAITGGVGYEYASRLIGGRVKLVVVKAGVEGAYAVGDNGVVYMANPPPRVRVVDVTGAGDSFNAAFLVWLKSGRSIGESLRAGVAAGTAKVARMGSSNMPSLAEVVELLGSTPPCRVLRA